MTKKMSCVVLPLSLVLGGWMLFDGIHVLLYGRYFGPPEPGPWSLVASGLGIDPFALGPVFIVWGGLWLAAALLLVMGWSHQRPLHMLLCAASLWYLPFGTLFGVVIFILHGWEARSQRQA